MLIILVLVFCADGGRIQQLLQQQRRTYLFGIAPTNDLCLQVNHYQCQIFYTNPLWCFCGNSCNYQETRMLVCVCRLHLERLLRSEGTLLPITLKLAYPEVASSLQLNTKWRNFKKICHWLLNPRRVIVFLSLATEPSESELRKEVKSGNSETVSICHHYESVSLW